MRSNIKKERVDDDDRNSDRRDRDRRRDDRTEPKAFGWSKKRVALSRSGKKTKGRGVFVRISSSMFITLIRTFFFSVEIPNSIQIKE